MPHDFNSRLSLSRHSTDRNGIARTQPELLDVLWNADTTRIVALSQGKARTINNALVFLSSVERDALEIAFPAGGGILRLYLGESLEATPSEPAGTPFIAIVLDEDHLSILATDNVEWADLRTVAPGLSDRDAGLFTQALALGNWHASHSHSPRTGEPTHSDQSGWVRVSSADGPQVFPRTDPAVIVMITDDEDRLLLGNNALWESNRYSLLAGFVEPGESLEAAVIREVFEESGVPVVDPVYLGSQPWPFPASLMLGFHAKVAPGFDPANFVPDGEEILSVRWFTRDELRASLETVVLPGPVSIARAMIEHWLGEPIDQDVTWLGTR
jgi:NAD+ diphosphatase